MRERKWKMRNIHLYQDIMQTKSCDPKAHHTSHAERKCQWNKKKMHKNQTRAQVRLGE